MIPAPDGPDFLSAQQLLQLVRNPYRIRLRKDLLRFRTAWLNEYPCLPDAINLSDALNDADIVVTGEGQLDRQTAMGKAPVGVAKLAKAHGAKVLAFSGSVTKEAVACNQAGIDAFFPILRRIVTLEEAMEPSTARSNMTASVEQVFRLL